MWIMHSKEIQIQQQVHKSWLWDSYILFLMETKMLRGSSLSQVKVHPAHQKSLRTHILKDPNGAKATTKKHIHAKPSKIPQKSKSNCGRIRSKWVASILSVPSASAIAAARCTASANTKCPLKHIAINKLDHLNQRNSVEPVTKFRRSSQLNFNVFALAASQLSKQWIHNSK